MLVLEEMRERVGTIVPEISKINKTSKFLERKKQTKNKNRLFKLSGDFN